MGVYIKWLNIGFAHLLKVLKYARKREQSSAYLNMEISISSLKCMKFDNDYYLRGLVSICHFTPMNCVLLEAN